MALVLAAVACFSVLDTSAKYVSASVPLLMALWFRYFFQAAATTAVVLPLRGPSVLRTAHPKFHCLRGLLLLLSSLFAFLSLKYMPVAEFTAVVAITPLVLTLLASTALAEKVSALRWSLVGGGFVGTLIILRPGGEDFDWTLLLPLCVVVTNTGFQVL
ncbi:MAG: EamA family transporter, partial [Polaromonas sp.]|nr:EamA family transporter [Polaromonas sp.]